MERPSLGNPMEVSAYWTPQHLDVTDAPVRYAGPKATWIEEFQRLRRFVRSDADDRMARRRVQSRAVVDSAEIIPLPPLAVPPRASAVPRGTAGERWYRAVLRGGRAAT